MKNPNGEVVLDKIFTSGKVSGSKYIMTASPGEQINKVIHAATSMVMKDAALATHKALASNDLLVQSVESADSE